MILFFCLLGVYTVNNSWVEIIIMIIFGGIGYLMRKFGYEGAPLVLAFVLSPMLENAFRQALIMSGGSFDIFFTRPISLVFLLVTITLLLLPLIPGLRKIPKGETQ